MTKPAAITGNYADLRAVKTRSVVQIVIEVPIEQGEAVVSMFGFPQPGKEVPVALARLVGKVPSVEPVEKRTWDQMPRAAQAGIRCAEESFKRFLREEHLATINEDDDAAATVRGILDVRSRSQLNEPGPASRWDRLESEYQAWLRAG